MPADRRIRLLRGQYRMWRRQKSSRDGSETGFDLAAVINDDLTFRSWYDMTVPRVYAYLYSRTGSVSVAEELTQEVFVEVVRSPRTFDRRSDVLPWVIGIARHRLSRHFRTNKLIDRRQAS